MENQGPRLGAIYHVKRFFGALRAPQHGVGPQHWKDSWALNSPLHPGWVSSLWSGSWAWLPGSGCQEPLLVGPVSSPPATPGQMRPRDATHLSAEQVHSVRQGLSRQPIGPFVPVPGPWAHRAVSPHSLNNGPKSLFWMETTPTRCLPGAHFHFQVINPEKLVS